MKNEKSKCIVVSTCRQYVCIWIFHSSLLVLHLNTHNVAIVPADFKSAGIEYKKQSSRAAGYVATRLMFRLICNLPEMNIRIYLIRLLPI